MLAVSATGNDRPPEGVECWTAITVGEDVELGNVDVGDGELVGTEFGSTAFGGTAFGGTEFGDVDFGGGKFGEVERDVGGITVSCSLASTAELSSTVAGL